MHDAGHPRRWQALGVLIASLTVVMLGNTQLNVAIPTLARELEATATELHWIVDAYSLVFAGLLLPFGALGDRFGRRGALVTGMTIYAVASTAAAFGTDPVHLIAARGVAGVGAALVMPATLSILNTIFPAHERARAIAIWAAFSGAAGILGPIVGGAVLDHFWWGSAFLVAVPVAAASVVAALLIVPTSSDPDDAPLDPVGSVLSVVALATLLYAIIEAPDKGWGNPTTLGLLVTAAAVIAVFLNWERGRERPMLPVAFFADRRFSVSSAAIAMAFFAMFGVSLVVTQYLQFVHGYSPFEAGIRVLPAPLGIMTLGSSVPRIAARFGVRRVMMVGMLAIGVAMLGLGSLSATSPYALLAGTMFCLGSGAALTMAPGTNLLMDSLPRAKSGVGSAMNDTTREIGGALGIGILGTLLTMGYRANIGDLPAALPAPAAAAARESIGGAAAVADAVGGSTAAAVLDTAGQAFVQAMGISALVAAAVAFAGAAVIRVFLPGDLALYTAVEPAVGDEPLAAVGPALAAEMP